jgi:hypothetical protein
MAPEPFRIWPVPIYRLGINWLSFPKAAHLGIVSSLEGAASFSGLFWI